MDQREQLQQAIRALEAQRILLGDEAGVGKSRLLYEFTNWIELLPQTVFFFKGRASPELSTSPYALVRDLFAERFEIQESDGAATARDKLEQGITSFMGADESGRMRAHIIGHLLGFDSVCSMRAGRFCLPTTENLALPMVVLAVSSAGV